MTNINTLLDKADRVYHQLMGHRPQLESLLSKVNEAAPEKPQVCLSALISVRQINGFFLLNYTKKFWVCHSCFHDSSQDDTGAGAGLGTSTASVNRYIQQLAQEYSGDCKTSFDELSKIIQVREK